MYEQVRVRVYSVHKTISLEEICNRKHEKKKAKKTRNQINRIIIYSFQKHREHFVCNWK